MAAKLGPVAQAIVRVLNDLNSEIVEVETLAQKVQWDRSIIVITLKELQEAGYGTFTVGRRGQPSRFHWVPKTSEPLLVSSEHAASSPDALDFPTERGTPDASDHEQVLLLKREKPVKIRVPADLTEAEAHKIIEWIKVISA